MTSYRDESSRGILAPAAGSPEEAELELGPPNSSPPAMSEALIPGEEKQALTERLSHFVSELQRRRVLRTATLYPVLAYGLIEGSDLLLPLLGVTEAEPILRVLLWTAILLYPVALALSWWLKTTVGIEEGREEAEAARKREERILALRADTIAVLPFRDVGDDPENSIFSEGVTYDVLMSLSHIPGLRVLPITTVQQYRNVNLKPEEIAGELGAATLVMGTVQSSGPRIRVSIEVIDARAEEHLWTGTYDRDLEDIFQVQTDIATRVAQAVEVELSPAARRRIETRGTSDREAYVLYLKARFLWNQRSEASVAESIGYFRRALERDPGFALAHSGLADAYTILGVYGLRAPMETLESARQAASTALSIDPLLGEAMATRACVTAILDWQWAEARRGFEEALRLAPSYATAHQWYAVNVLTPLRRFEDARAQLETALELDPRSSAIATSLGIVAFYAGQTGEAVEEFEAVVKVHPSFSLVHYFLGQSYGLLGDGERAIESLERAAALADESSETLAALGHALAAAGRTAEAEAILHRLEERSEHRYVSSALLAQVLIGLERYDEALDRLEQATQDRATDLIWLGVRPVYDRLRGSPRFEAILEQLGLSQA